MEGREVGKEGGKEGQREVGRERGRKGCVGLRKLKRLLNISFILFLLHIFVSETSLRCCVRLGRLVGLKLHFHAPMGDLFC